MKRISPPVAYTLSAVVHVGIFVWAWKLPARPRPAEHVDIQVIETEKPKPVEPEPPKPEPPKPEPPVVKMKPVRRVALAPPPPTNEPPPETPPPETPPPTTTPTTAPGPVHLGLSLSSTSVGGAFAAPVGNSLAGKPGPHAAAPAADDVGPITHAAALTEQPEPISCEIPPSEYPKAALDAGFEGSVPLKLTLDATGHVRRVKVLKDPGYGLAAVAAKHAMHFTFKPGKLNGVPTTTEIPYTVTFELP
ncbi:MAG TPA: energy transducer TonB [Polyangia bacterium]|nr:energy transducer TonB [Polyangia bacterium]